MSDAEPKSLRGAYPGLGPPGTPRRRRVPEPLAEVQGQVAGLPHRPVARRVGGDAAEVQPAVPCRAR